MTLGSPAASQQVASASIQGFGYRGQSSGSPGFRVQGLGFRALGLWSSGLWMLSKNHRYNKSPSRFAINALNKVPPYL